MTTTISPGSTSLTNSASIKSKAHVSDANVSEFPNFPIASGLNPLGSLTAIIISGLKNSNEYAPLHLERASIILLANVSSFDRAIRCRITSVSVVDWKIEPSLSSSSLSLFAFVKLPLWAIESSLFAYLMLIGWVFLM